MQRLYEILECVAVRGDDGEIRVAAAVGFQDIL
jgi:hypothetical protein